MSDQIKEPSKDTTRLGDQAAKQPLSGIQVVSASSVKGFNNSAPFHAEAKKSA